MLPSQTFVQTQLAREPVMSYKEKSGKVTKMTHHQCHTFDCLLDIGQDGQTRTVGLLFRGFAKVSNDIRCSFPYFAIIRLHVA